MPPQRPSNQPLAPARPRRKRAKAVPGQQAAIAAAAGFVEGDVVLDAGMPSRVGTVCRVLTAGLTYRVRFADDVRCTVAPHSALAPAPAGTAGPACTPDC